MCLVLRKPDADTTEDQTEKDDCLGKDSKGGNWGKLECHGSELPN